jgi:murein DD-endopeptidase MepM/ murein hydrolase activator NlpD
VAPPPAAAARIAKERAVLNAMYDDNQTPRQWRRPFERPATGATTGSFGMRSVFNGRPRSPHAGVDFRGPTGAPVTAPAAGIVALADDLFFTGNTVVVDHGQGLYSVLAHLSELHVAEGDTVTRGDLVGRIGRTGRATGPHLHWSVRLNGARIDPLSLIRATSGRN